MNLNIRGLILVKKIKLYKTIQFKDKRLLLWFIKKYMS